MANFKRKKSKRSVRCTICTRYRWRGNNAGRRTIRDLRELEPSQKLETDLGDYEKEKRELYRELGS